MAGSILNSEFHSRFQVQDSLILWCCWRKWFCWDTSLSASAASISFHPKVILVCSWWPNIIIIWEHFVVYFSNKSWYFVLILNVSAGHSFHITYVRFKLQIRPGCIFVTYRKWYHIVTSYYGENTEFFQVIVNPFGFEWSSCA